MAEKDVLPERIEDEFIFLCITDTEFLKTVRQALKPEYFSEIPQTVICVCYSYFDEYKEAPTSPPHDHFHDELVNSLQGKSREVKETYLVYVKKIRKMSPPNKEYIFDRVNDFIGPRKAENYALEYVKSIERGELNQANLVAAKIGNLNLGETDFIRGLKQKPITRRLSEVEPEQVEWLWYNKIPIGMVTLLVGDPKVGKSMLTDYIAAQTTTGKVWPDCNRNSTKGSVIMLAAEDNISAILRPRLEQFNADLNQIITLEGIKTEDTEEKREFAVKDIDILEQTLTDNPDTRLVIIDPISRYLGKINMNDQSDVVSAISPLNGLAEKYNMAIILVAHLNKNIATQAAYRVQGSIGFVTTARVSWQLMRAKEDKDNVLFIPLMGNVCIQPEGLSFRIEGRADDGTLYLNWSSEVITESIDELTSASNKEKEAESKTLTAEAMKFLKILLEDGEKDSKIIVELAEEQGLKFGTLSIAAKRLGIKKRREGRRGEAKSWWSLPEPE